MKLPRPLCATPLAFAAVGLAAPAQAINLAPNGKGEVLIFPYYTVRNGFDTLISVTNTADRTVLANLRLREAKNGRPVREFHLALSPHDVWTGAVTLDGTDGALIRTFDASCTAPALGNGPSGSRQIALTPTNYDGSGALPYDNGGTQLSRVQEGFIEVIEMGISTVPESAIPTTGSSIETASQHVAGVPRDCAVVHNLFADPANFASSGSGTALPASAFSSFEAPKNVLFGSATLINVGSGHAYDATPTAVQNFRNTTLIIYRADSGKPTLTNGDAGMTATQFDREGNVVSIANITKSVDAVSALLMTPSFTNEFAAGNTASSSAKTDWVLTFPTKHFYTDPAETSSSIGLPPFQAYSEASLGCVRYGASWYGREEQSNGLVFPAVFPPVVGLCASTNIAVFSNGPPASLLGAPEDRVLSLGASSVGGAGWARVAFGETNGLGGLLGLSGLPAIGFSVIERNNSAEAGNNRNYGSGRPHVVDLISP